MPASIVRCTNRDCPHFGADRRVEMVEAGPGLYARPLIVCECKQQPMTVDGWLAEPDAYPADPPGPRTAVKSAPRRRGSRA